MRKTVTPTGSPFDMTLGMPGFFLPGYELQLRNFLSYAMTEFSFENIYAYGVILQYRKKPLLCHARMICHDFFLDESAASINIARGDKDSGIAFHSMKSAIENLDIIQESSARNMSMPADMLDFALGQLESCMADTFSRLQFNKQSSTLKGSILYIKYTTPSAEEKNKIMGYYTRYEKAGLKLQAGLKLY